MKLNMTIKCVSVIAAVLIALIAILNISPGFAAAAANAPVIGGLAQLLTFRAYEDVGGGHDLQIDSAKVTGLNNADVEKSLNEKYSARSRQLYEDFMAEVNDGGDNITLFSGYTIKAQTDNTVSIENSLFTSAASGNTQLTYDTVDTKNGVYLTLPVLFKDDGYIMIISDAIQAEIREQMAADENKTYFTDDDAFKSIAENQAFYINGDHKLVIVFDSYAIAPGYMGTPEFVISTDVLKDVVCGNDYLR